jgi:hypothetical protein
MSPMHMATHFEILQDANSNKSARHTKLGWPTINFADVNALMTIHYCKVFINYSTNHIAKLACSIQLKNKVSCC